MSLKYGLILPQGYGRELLGIKDPIEAYETMTRMAQVAEESGFEAVWTAALARDTKRIRVGQMVTANSYRNPALQAKMASTLDVLSHGRYTFGIGAGYYEPDYRMYGYEYPEPGVRLSQLREAVQVIRALWSSEEATFEGTYYHIHNAINQPKGVQKPHIPLMIAGGGEKVTLKLVAQYADACNVMGEFAAITHKFNVIKQHCETVGRDYESIYRTAVAPCCIGETDEQARALFHATPQPPFPGDPLAYGLIGSLETVRQRLADYETAGVQELDLWFVEGTNPEALRRFAREFIFS